MIYLCMISLYNKSINRRNQFYFLGEVMPMRCNTLLLFYCAATALLGLFCLARLLAIWVRDILFSRRKQAFLARLRELFEAYDQLIRPSLWHSHAT